MSKKTKVNLITIACGILFVIGIFVLIRLDAVKTEDELSNIRESGLNGYKDWLNE